MINDSMLSTLAHMEEKGYKSVLKSATVNGLYVEMCNEESFRMFSLDGSDPSESSFTKHLKLLEDFGYVSVIKKSGRTKCYVITEDGSKYILGEITKAQ